MHRFRFPTLTVLGLSLLLAGCGLDTDGLLDDIGLSGEATVASPIAGGEEALSVALVNLDDLEPEVAPAVATVDPLVPRYDFLMSDRRGARDSGADDALAERERQRRDALLDARLQKQQAMERALEEIERRKLEQQERVNGLLNRLDARNQKAREQLQKKAESNRPSPPPGFDMPVRTVDGGFDLDGVSSIDAALRKLTLMRQPITVDALSWTSDGEEAPANGSEARIAEIVLDVFVLDAETLGTVAEVTGTMEGDETIAYVWNEDTDAYEPDGETIELTLEFDAADARDVLTALRDEKALEIGYDLALVVEGLPELGSPSIELSAGEATLSF